MHVLETARGAGVGRKLLSEVLEQSRGRGYAKLWLETGTRPASAAARRLYARAGFRECPPFGEYAEDPESVFMVLVLT
jgi:putative acetyltransferase